MYWKINEFTSGDAQRYTAKDFSATIRLRAAVAYILPQRSKQGAWGRIYLPALWNQYEIHNVLEHTAIDVAYSDKIRLKSYAPGR